MGEDQQQNVWGIAPGTPGLSSRLFHQDCAAAVQWEGVGDLSHLPPRLAAFRKFIECCRPDLPTAISATWARRTFEFVHAMQFQDWEVRADPNSDEVNVAFVSGSYRYTRELDPSHPHIRTIHWYHDVPRRRLSHGALAEISMAAEFFRVVNFAEEIVTAVKDSLNNAH